MKKVCGNVSLLMRKQSARYSNTLQKDVFATCSNLERNNEIVAAIVATNVDYLGIGKRFVNPFRNVKNKAKDCGNCAPIRKA